tara:strand:+ start:57 stop:341 length:285 start_codon:yes stop_codon:yes gene_type:complete
MTEFNRKNIDRARKTAEFKRECCKKNSRIYYISSNTLDDIITELKDKDVMLVDIDQNHAMYHGDDGIYGNRAERIVYLSKLIGKLESIREVRHE